MCADCANKIIQSTSQYFWCLINNNKIFFERSLKIINFDLIFENHEMVENS